MQHFTAVAEMINFNCVPKFRIYILRSSSAATFSLYFNRFLEDVNFVIFDLCFQVWFYGLNNRCSSPYALPVSSQCHVVVRREILVQSPGVADEHEPYVPDFLPRLLCVLHWQTSPPKQFWITLYHSLLMSQGSSCYILVIFIKLLWGMKLYSFYPHDELVKN